MKIAFDTGGTFTDFAMLDDSGSVYLHKVLSTPHDPSEAVLQGVDDLLERLPAAQRHRPLQILGATTVVTNAVLERRGAATAFITTSGFEDMLRIRTEGRYDLYDLNIQYPAPLVPSEFCIGAPERIAADGTVVKPLDRKAVASIRDHLKASGVRSVAVCLLHAYKYPEHEQMIAEVFAEGDSGGADSLSVSLSSEVCPEVREYDRASTTVANAYTQPLMQKHVARLADELSLRGIRSQLLWMTSSGGVVPSTSAGRLPVRLIESGPAAGAVAAADYARAAGESSVLSFDMGGTTAKLCLIPNGEPRIANELEVARFERFRKGSGFPLKIQSIHMIEIGAGGGSIAAKSPLGLLAVGPRSASAVPGPACYGRGGTEPTVTDADLLLGYVDEGSFLGGDFALNRPAADTAMARLAATMEITTERCAWGIHEMVNDSMAKAAAMQATESGMDPRALPLIAFGGAGPVHAYGVARKLGIRKVICPLGAGVTSAIGLLGAPVAADVSLSRPMLLGNWASETVSGWLDELAERARAVVAGSGIVEADIGYVYTADLRHSGQGHEINVTLPSLPPSDPGFIPEFTRRFYERYLALYGRTVKGAEIEVVTWRARAAGPRDAIDLGSVGGHRVETAALKGHRPAFFEGLGVVAKTPVYDHYALKQGEVIHGPAIVEQRESTAVVGPNATASLDKSANLIMLLD